MTYTQKQINEAMANLPTRLKAMNESPMNEEGIEKIAVYPCNWAEIAKSIRGLYSENGEGKYLADILGVKDMLDSTVVGFRKTGSEEGTREYSCSFVELDGDVVKLKFMMNLTGRGMRLNDFLKKVGGLSSLSKATKMQACLCHGYKNGWQITKINDGPVSPSTTGADEYSVKIYPGSNMSYRGDGIYIPKPIRTNSGKLIDADTVIDHINSVVYKNGKAIAYHRATGEKFVPYKMMSGDDFVHLMFEGEYEDISDIKTKAKNDDLLA